MNRYKYSKPSLATADTLCQKCLKKGHYSYECTAAQQDRPYVSRPSRMQQFLNPKLAPKITEPVPKALEPSRTEKSAAVEVSKRKITEDETEDLPRKRSRSVSTSSSDSISSISTTRSPSASRSPPGRRRRQSPVDEQRSSNTIKPSIRGPTNEGLNRTTDRSTEKSSRRKSSAGSDTRRTRVSDRPRERHGRYLSRSRSRSRSTVTSRPSGRVRSRSRSPYRRRDPEADPVGKANSISQRRPSDNDQRRERSLSPYSKRVALKKGNR